MKLALGQGAAVQVRAGIGAGGGLIARVDPLKRITVRLAGSLLLIAPALLAAGQKLMPYCDERLVLFWVGALQVAGFLICSIIGLSVLPAGRAIALAYTMPLWVIPIGIFIWQSRAQLLGAAIGFAGLVLFMNPGLVDWRDPRILAANALLVVGARLVSLSPPQFYIALLGADLLAASGKHRADRRGHLCGVAPLSAAAAAREREGDTGGSL